MTRTAVPTNGDCSSGSNAPERRESTGQSGSRSLRCQVPLDTVVMPDRERWIVPSARRPVCASPLHAGLTSHGLNQVGYTFGIAPSRASNPV